MTEEEAEAFKEEVAALGKRRKVHLQTWLKQTNLERE
jgi:hypothetical protein